MSVHLTRISETVSTLFVVLAVAVLVIQCGQKSPTTLQYWYQGNTHSHTSLCDHSDMHPDSVALWYLEHGYNFLILSEHDLFIDPGTINLPLDRREDFILIPGQELSAYNHVHTTAMNISGELRPHRHGADGKVIFSDPSDAGNVSLMQLYSDTTRAAGGIPILNHPNYAQGIPARDIAQVEGLELIELYNGHPQAYNWGRPDRPSTEEKWDSLLTVGKRIFAVSADDSHAYYRWGPHLSNPGRGWVMVESDELTPAAITNAMELGKFYASNGVVLRTVKTADNRYEIAVDTQETYRKIEQEYVIGNKVDTASEGFVIQFIVDGGEVYLAVDAASAAVDLPKNRSYLRARITFSVRRSDHFEQFYAWTQPVFRDKRNVISTAGDEY